MQIKTLQTKDHAKAINFAIQGMQFQKYLKNPILLQLYGKYFWYKELLLATRILAAYEGETLLGVLLVNLSGEKKAYQSFSKSLFVKTVDLIEKLFFTGSASLYHEANKAMLTNYKKQNQPDGEIVFLAADPSLKGKGVGSFLLQALTEQVQGKELYLYTDNHCNYHFYEKRGFERIGEKQIQMALEDTVDLKCLLYRKKFSVV